MRDALDKQIVLRSSSSGFAWGELIFSKYKSTCLRWILVSSHIPFEIDPKYTEFGKVNEDLHEKELERDRSQFMRELEVEMPSPVDGVINRGHIDFVVKPLGETVWEVHELKHVQSKNVYRDVLKNGHYIVDNLAQCINYMLQAKTQRGLLKYTFYDKDAFGKLEPVKSRGFEVGIDQYGRVFVDKEPTEYTVFDQLNHQRQAATALKEQRVMQRPYNGEALFVGACHWCPVKSACAAWDKGEIEGTEAFVDQCKELLDLKKGESDE